MEKDKMNERFKENVVVKEVSEVHDKAELEDANGSGMDNVHCTFVNNINKVINSNVSKVSNVETPVSYVGTLTKNVTADDNKLFNIPTSVNSKGEEVVLFDEDLVLEGCEKWKLTVCGYFVGCKMHINVLKYNIKRMWTRFGLKDIVVDADEMCFFKFKDEEEKKTPCKVPVWIRLYNVPLEAWSIKGISAISSRLGRPIMMDQMTSNMCKEGSERLGYARVLVEVDAGKEYLEKNEINYVDAMKKVKLTKWVKVEYSWKPDRCKHCKVFGHTINYCKAKQVNGKSEANQEASANGNQADNEGFVKVKNRKKNNGNAAGMNNGTQVNKQSYKRKFGILSQKNIMEMRKNANKYVVILEEVNDEEFGDNVCQDDRLIVDRYILMKSKPPPEEMMKWTYDMKLYFKYRWDAVNRENENSDEEDIIEEVNAIKDFVADEIGGGDSQLLN
ncbi:RNA-directed DNA polymerase, eukaryota, reverse transcriptase zinc-binding domain protein [Tanacetum coccineum]